jgi:Uma2 family endonuclease
MRTLFVTDPPPVVEDWLARRHALGQDLYDEVWEGEYHVAPAPGSKHSRLQVTLARILGPLADAAGLEGGGPCNIGRPGDFRVPDLVYVRDWADRVWNPTASIVVEIVSPGDESRGKLDFYLRSGVEEVLIVDPDARTVEWFARMAEAFARAGGSRILGITTLELSASLEWPG